MPTLLAYRCHRWAILVIPDSRAIACYVTSLDALNSCVTVWVIITGIEHQEEVVIPTLERLGTRLDYRRWESSCCLPTQRPHFCDPTK